jgi:hypothetical protein
MELGRTQRVLPSLQELLMAHIRSMRVEDHDNFLDHILSQSIENLPDRPKNAIYARTTEADTAYAERTKVMCIEITLSSVPRVAEEQARTSLAKKPGKHLELKPSHCQNQSPFTTWMGWRMHEGRSANTAGPKSDKETRSTQ